MGRLLHTGGARGVLGIVLAASLALGAAGCGGGGASSTEDESSPAGQASASSFQQANNQIQAAINAAEPALSLAADGVRKPGQFAPMLQALKSAQGKLTGLPSSQDAQLLQGSVSSLIKDFSQSPVNVGQASSDIGQYKADAVRYGGDANLPAS